MVVCFGSMFCVGLFISDINVVLICDFFVECEDWWMWVFSGYDMLIYVVWFFDLKIY